MSKLAINGGAPVRTRLFGNQSNIGPEEMQAVQRVMETGMLSGYRGNAQKYRGGVEVQALERQFSEKFNVKHSIAINSCTSALHVACGAIGLKPGDEVIVSPYSMTCSATAPMLWGATPVFADVEKDYFCLDPESVESKITERTKAIIAVDLFGQPFGLELQQIAARYNLYLIEDAAQALGAARKEYIPLYDETDNGKIYKDTYTGNLGHISCFSFTQGKHITSGEGGMITTNDSDLAFRCRMLMNHAEAVVNDKIDIDPIWNRANTKSMWGFNLRMTEIQAAIVQEQLKKLDFFIGKRQENAGYMLKIIENILPIHLPKIRPYCRHTFYCQAFLWDQEVNEGIHRDTFINAVKAELQPMKGREEEGVRIGNGYIKPLYRMPIFSNRFFNSERPKGINRDIIPLPNVEKLWKDELFLHLYLAPPTNRADLDDIIEAFNKVWKYRDELR